MAYSINNQDFSIISSFCINTEMNFMKSKYRKRKWEFNNSEFIENPDVVIKSELPRFRFIMAPSIYHELLSLLEIFHFEGEDWPLPTTDQGIILDNKQQTGMHMWEQYTACLYGAYIYFFKGRTPLIIM